MTHHVELKEPVDLALPVHYYFTAFADDECAFLLDSGVDPEKLGRYSYVGGDPFIVYRAWRNKGRASVEVTRFRDRSRRRPSGTEVETRNVDFFDDLRAQLAEYYIPSSSAAGDRHPVTAGAFGWVGYEAGHFVENLPEQARDDLLLPDVCLMFVDAVLCHCHRSNRSWVSAVGWGESNSAAEDCARAALDEFLLRIAAVEANPPRPWIAPPVSGSPGKPKPSGVTAHFDQASYCRAVDRVKDHILAGDVFEVCLTHRLEAPQPAPAWDIYRELRRINPAPFAAFLRTPEAEIISASPERFLSLDASGLIEARPIKGTRPRGASAAEDRALREELASSEKDRAENLMIVDLLRNDIGRVAQFGSVEVPELLTVETYATVFQLVSTIRGRLREEHDALDLLRACFPGGSMTGAPKIEAMKIIDSMEPVQRSVYAGGIGYFDFQGTLDLNIVIRSLICKNDKCYFNVGGAIVADSDPVDEWRETMDKARAILQALENLAGGSV